MARESFVLHQEYIEGIPEEHQWKWLKRIMDFVFCDTEPEFDNWVDNKIWLSIKSRLEADFAQYDKSCERLNAYREQHKKYMSDKRADKNSSRANLCESVRTRANLCESVRIGDSNNFALCGDTDTDTDTDSDSEFKSVSDIEFDSEFKSVSVFDSVSDIEFESVKESRDKSTRFIPPSLEMVDNYIKEKGYVVSPEAFINFYEAKGWMIGKNKMKDWKAAVRNWVSRDKQEHPEKQVTLKHYEDDTW